MSRKTVRLIGIILILCTLVTSSSCGGPVLPGTPTAGGEVTEAPGSSADTNAADPGKIDLSAYRIILPGKATTELQKEVELLMKTIRFYTGVTLPIFEDDVEKSGEGKKEILVGKTNRTQSVSAIGEISGEGFLIANEGGTILIGGTSHSASCDAVEYFMSALLGARSGAGTLDMADGYRYDSTYETVALLKSGTTDFRIVYSASLDDTEDYGYVNDGIDYEVKLARDLQEKLAFYGCRVELVKDSAEATAHEILVGKTNRPESTAFLNGMNGAQYGVGVSNGKITVGGLSAAATGLAVESLIKQISAAALDSSILLPLGKFCLRTNPEWTVNFPEFKGGKLYGTSESYYGEMQYYYKGATEDSYRAYCAQLEDAGYACTFTNEIDGNLFASYKTKNVLIYIYFVPAEKSVRLIVGNPSKVNFPSTESPVYEKITDISITQIQLDYSTNSGGMGYIITLEDGSFLLIDSGSRNSEKQAENMDHVRIWNLLNQLNCRADKKIIIRGWFITHCHTDHIRVFEEFCKTFGPKVIIEKYYECVVPESVAFNAKNPEFHVAKGWVETCLGYTQGKSEMVMLHTGMHLSLYGLEMDVLYTAEDLYPNPLHYFNSASSVLKINVKGYDLLILGDVFSDACKVMINRYPTALKSDMVQVSHHGNQGATKAFYDKVDPSVALWPTSETLFKQLTAGTGTTSYYVIDYHLYKELNVKENYTNSDYSVRLTLPYVLGSAEKLKVPVTNQYP